MLLLEFLGDVRGSLRHFGSCPDCGAQHMSTSARVARKPGADHLLLCERCAALYVTAGVVMVRCSDCGSEPCECGPEIVYPGDPLPRFRIEDARAMGYGEFGERFDCVARCRQIRANGNTDQGLCVLDRATNLRIPLDVFASRAFARVRASRVA